MNAAKLTTNGLKAWDGDRPAPAFPLHRLCRKLLPGDWQWVGSLWVGEVTVTPEAAATLLKDHNNDNRPLDLAQIAVLTHAIQTGLFMVNGDTIKFDRDFNGKDLQHRCHATVRAGKPITTLAVYGIKPAAFKTLDQHSRRSLPDMLAIKKEENPRVLAGALNFIHYFMEKGKLVRGQAKKLVMTNADLMEGIEKYEGIRESVAFAVKHKKTARKFTGPNLLAALHWIFSKVDHGLADEFLLAVLENSVPRTNSWSAVRVLAVLLEKNLTAHKLGRGDTERYVVKAWNALREGTKVERLRLPPNNVFPQVSGWNYNEQVCPVIG